MRGPIPLLLGCVIFSASVFAAEPEDPVQAAQELWTRLAAAYDAGDSQGLSALWAEDGDLAALSGTILRGRPAVAKFWEEALKTVYRDTRLVCELDSARRVADGVILVDGLWSAKGAHPPHDRSDPGAVSQVLVRSPSGWLIAMSRGVPLQGRPREAGRPAPASPALPERVSLGEDLEVRRLGQGVWLHVSWLDLPKYGPVSSNGLLIAAPAGALLIDTPWNDDQTRRLLRWADAALGLKARALVATHAHHDRMGGIRAAAEAGAETWSGGMTAAMAPALGLPAPQHVFDLSAVLELAGERVEAFYPGPAHSSDNVAVWLPGRKVLFAGCLVRAAEAGDLGSLEDANVELWRDAATAVMSRFPSADIVIPGHGLPGGYGLFEHTLRLVDAAQGKAR